MTSSIDQILRCDGFALNIAHNVHQYINAEIQSHSLIKFEIQKLLFNQISMNDSISNLKANHYNTQGMAVVHRPF